jgi:glutaredoxin 3
MNKITVYTTEPCGYCRQAKALLDKRGLSFDEINLARDADGRAELAARTGMMTFPQVIIGDELVGGFTELVSADRTGRLADLVSAEPLI